ncbi:hypothetical protein N0754_17875 [Pseudomonas aeruginosa]|nr:hypothetical protein [Pseudomonas aeruginosa]MCS9764101.1 hypothetical protein [Pseudomonas aeruginosa]MCS9820278.1 hypothetical protein [Pseudomonas aeruginosa]MCT0240859.1 hypothetical protein [Pseudomonas aeruginosa]MCT0528311.1 hypothetical protein [Pseudomonas aeruginosa]
MLQSTPGLTADRAKPEGVALHEARILFGRNGELKQTIDAFSITSPEHYRNLWPLVTPTDPPRMVCWVSPVFQGEECKRRSHFRTLRKSVNPVAVFRDEEEARTKAGESAIHRTAKEVLAAELQRRIDSGLGLPWAFKHDSAGGFPMVGNLLLGARRAVIEHRIKTAPPLDSTYRLDIAILGDPAIRNELLLGAVEIEHKHSFDGRKALAGKSGGYPLISVDVSDMQLEEITPAWAARVLSETSRTVQSGGRSTFVYLNPLLYPLYAQIPPEIARHAARHQFIIFAPDKDLVNARDKITTAAHALGLAQDVNVQLIKAVNEQCAIRIRNLGRIVGRDWQDHNPEACLLVSLDRPHSVLDLSRHKMHHFLALFLAGWGNALVGYRWREGVLPNEDDTSDVWVERLGGKSYTTLPKRLAMPLRRYIEALSSLS